MARTVEILSPIALGPTEQHPLAAPVADLRGRRLGIRHDRAWRSFDVFAGRLAELARAELGVEEVVLFDPGPRVGRPEDESRRVAEFARTVDAAVVGLGT